MHLLFLLPGKHIKQKLIVIRFIEKNWLPKNISDEKFLAPGRHLHTVESAREQRQVLPAELLLTRAKNSVSPYAE